MTEQEYLETRVNDQIDWYDKKSGWNKRQYTRMKVAEMVMALLIPFLTGYISTGPGATPLKVTVGLLGVAVAALTGLLTLYKFQENWIQYRSVSELLKQEKYLYVTKAGPYKESNSLPTFVERFESYLSKENTQWASYFSAKDDKKEDKPNAVVLPQAVN